MKTETTSSADAAEDFILLVDDEPDAVVLTRVAFAKAGVTHPLVVRENGAEAIALMHELLARDATLPLALLLDLRLPLINGFDVLAWVRGTPALEELFVVVQSTSTSPEDIERAYRLGAKAYLCKYPSAPELAAVINTALASARARAGAPQTGRKSLSN